MRSAVVSGVALVVLATTAWTDAATPLAAPDRAPAFTRLALSVEGQPYRLVRDRNRVVVRAANQRVHPNRRELFHRPGVRATRDQTTCATWVHESGELVQEGLAVRIVQRRSGTVKAIALTKNTVFNVHTVINLLTFNTRRTGDPWRSLGQFDMAAVVAKGSGAVRPLPWRVCLRAVGRTATFKIWLPRAAGGEPTWRDPVHTRSVPVPPGFVFAGAPGWYVGHVPDGGSVTYRGLTTS